VAELVWREVVRAEPQNEDEGAELAPRNDRARRLAGCDADAVEVNHAKIRRTAS
jgi:hypothetical protein